MYNSELGRRLRNQSSNTSLNSPDRRGSSHSTVGHSRSRDHRSPSRNTRTSTFDGSRIQSDLTGLTGSGSNSAGSSSYLTESLATQFMSSSPSTSSHSLASASTNGPAGIPGSWNDSEGSSGVATTSVLRSESPRRKAAVPFGVSGSIGSGHSYRERPRTPNKRGGVHADRYVPSRHDSDEQAAAFQLLPGQPATARHQKRKMAPDVDAEKEEADHTFANLLGAEIFGRENHAAATAASTPHASSMSSAPASAVGVSTSRPSSTAPTTPTKRNLFTYSSPSSSRSRSGGASRGRAGSSSSSSRRSFADDTMRASDRTFAELGSNAESPVSLSAGSTPRRRADASATGGLFGSASRSHRAFDADEIGSPLHRMYDTSPVKMESQRLLLSPRRAARTISKVPFKVLDAPDLADDFYLNLVDWSASNMLAVGLNRSVYLWSAQTSSVKQLVDLETSHDKVASVSWAGRGHHLAIGTHQGNVQIWDTEAGKLLRTMRGHSLRVGALAWNEHILTSGARDRTIYHRDVRVPEQYIRELHGHKQEVCNLEWNTETNQLASGGNDNKLLVWDALNTTPLHRFSEHSAAVKALAWSPHHQGILASGGGTADMKIRFWNTATGSLLSEVDTGSQVCNLMWSRTSNEIISTHGYSAGKVQNQIQVWRYPSMQQVATLTGHTMRVLYLAMSPDGETIVTGAGDETLRFWDLNTPSKSLQQDRGPLHTTTTGTLNPFAKLR